MSHWRDTAKPIISDVLRRAKENAWTESEIKQALRDAYPFGERAMWPYKIWLDEIGRQRQTKKSRPKARDGRLLIIDEKLQDKLL